MVSLEGESASTINSPTVKYYLGIDPGATGAWAIINDYWPQVNAYPFTTFKDFATHDNLDKKAFAVLEQVSAMPGQGVSSMFTFGQNYGGWQATLELMEISYQLATPQKWQKVILGTFPKGESKIRAAAFVSRRFPQWVPTKNKKTNEGIVDALCIALYARQLHLHEQEIIS